MGNKYNQEDLQSESKIRQESLKLTVEEELKTIMGDKAEELMK